MDADQMQYMVWVIWALSALMLVNAIIAIPLMWRRASSRAWMAQGVVAILLPLAAAWITYGLFYKDVVPWWQVAGAFLIIWAGPSLVLHIEGRALRRNARLAPWLIAVVMIGTLVCGLAGGWMLAPGLLPVMVNAVK